MERIRVLLVDDHPVVREGLRAMLQADEGIVVVGEASDGLEALGRIREEPPDVVLMDIRMPGLDGLEATRRIAAEWPQTAVVALTMYDQESLVRDAMKAGAAGYLVKDASRDLLLQTIRAVKAGASLGGARASPQLPQRKGHRAQMGIEALSPREREVLKLVAEGRTNRGIGQSLFISEDTAKKYVRSIIAKLGATNRTHAAMVATRAGLVGESPLG